MRKLALDDDILLNIEKPARYIGHEVNSVMKDKNAVDIRFAMCFPEVYEVGMSHLGIQILYDMFNRREDTWCERVYSPWIDLDKIMREKHIPLFTLESQDPVKDFDFLGITLQFEMCYTNVLQVLAFSGSLPLFVCFQKFIINHFALSDIEHIEKFCQWFCIVNTWATANDKWIF